IRLFYDSSKKIIEITDHGIGIPQEEINHIFQSFYRASNAREYPGYGIGLSLSLKILSYYGGKVEISSELNKYTTFSIIFE
ncbi:MAG: sensor histidine kinase, partial [Coprobacter sp.]